MSPARAWRSRVAHFSYLLLNVLGDIFCVTGAPSSGNHLKEGLCVHCGGMRSTSTSRPGSFVIGCLGPRRRICAWGSLAAGIASSVACFHLLPAYRTTSGEVVFSERGDIDASLWLPCGNCCGCRLERSRQWMIRVVHEAQMHSENAFVTLTYAPEKLPKGGSLHYPDFQRFMKYLRKHCREVDESRGVDPPRRVRFHMCGEYGESFARPHYHAAIFGEGFLTDRYFWRTSESGARCYRSATLERLWTLGNAELGDVTPESAGYIARYVLKKINGDAAQEHYKRVDPETGEVSVVAPEFSHMSLKPGVGATWFDRFHADVFPHDRVVVQGKVGKPPRFYDLRYKRLARQAFESLKDERSTAAGLKHSENSPERLAVREQVQSARLRFYKRQIG